jgi:hypothetical protein
MDQAARTKPTLGRIVHYQVHESDVALQSNGIKAGEFLAAVVTRIWNKDGDYADMVQLRVFVDGMQDGWKTSVHEGSTPGTWCWPPRA